MHAPALPPDAAILRALFAARDSYVSGSALAEQLGVTRAAVWKRMESLQEIGYPILSQPHSGYRLDEALPDILCADEIIARLPATRIPWRPVVFAETQSTNDLANREAHIGHPQGLCIAADRQTKGRGRRGRSWHARAGDSLLASVLLRPGWPLTQVARLTIVASLAIAEAAESLVPARIDIKWPNDLFHDGRKLGGILTEISADAETIGAAVVGFGVNCRQLPSDFPEELRAKATSLCQLAGGSVRRADLLLAILTRLDAWIAAPFEEAREAWARRCLSLGRLVSVETASGPRQGQALGLDENGALLLRGENGRVEAITAGDIA
ncbi:MAG: biotin--[acetyl-CoA-carboxylase] ligase [Verrucomicrobium sp.]|nr:biotin--[acetyl-CoA-carboxylase] ligase [Verrucomicrobium sp.]